MLLGCPLVRLGIWQGLLRIRDDFAEIDSMVCGVLCWLVHTRVITEVLILQLLKISSIENFYKGTQVQGDEFSPGMQLLHPCQVCFHSLNHNQFGLDLYPDSCQLNLLLECDKEGKWNAIFLSRESSLVSS